MAFTVDSAGRTALLTPAEVAAVRGHVRFALQSCPALLTGNGELPPELQAPGRGVSLDHRDSRLAIGTLDDGSVVVALTRFTGLGAGGETLPWGPAILEMAGFMRSLGCRRAMMLDGGISSQGPPHRRRHPHPLDQLAPRPAGNLRPPVARDPPSPPTVFRRGP